VIYPENRLLRAELNPHPASRDGQSLLRGLVPPKTLTPGGTEAAAPFVTIS